MMKLLVDDRGQPAMMTHQVSYGCESTAIVAVIPAVSWLRLPGALTEHVIQIVDIRLLF